MQLSLILMCMRRIQIHLHEDLDEALAEQARDRRISKAALIREYLEQHVTLRRRGTRDVSAGLVGVYEGAPDESASIDDVVSGR
jgi:predicted transcriptional regulator